MKNVVWISVMLLFISLPIIAQVNSVEEKTTEIKESEVTKPSSIMDAAKPLPNKMSVKPEKISIPVPELVSQAFQKKFAAVEKVIWSKEGEDFEAEFLLAGKQTEAVFNIDGEWLQTETKATTQDVPVAVRTAIKEQYKGYGLNKVEKVERLNKPISYMIEMVGQGKKLEIRAEESGKLTEEKSEKYNPEADEDKK